MKRCPYCAELIQDEAKVCRYCHKKVSGLWGRRIILIAVIAALLFFLVFYLAEAQKTIGDIRGLFIEFRQAWSSFGEMMRDVRKGLEALSYYLKDIEQVPSQKI
ncbi:MAG: hypothetical protein GF409_00990 [Candidatus Omnitrophica bacterium]|nr:hypothetical protein [Candidatus Omnitrophota bacterium]